MGTEQNRAERKLVIEESKEARQNRQIPWGAIAAIGAGGLVLMRGLDAYESYLTKRSKRLALTANTNAPSRVRVLTSGSRAGADDVVDAEIIEDE